jgi:hypothetical protein
VIADLGTLLTALYVELTDRIIPLLGFTRSGPGKPPDVTDAELVPHIPVNDLALSQCGRRRASG